MNERKIAEGIPSAPSTPIKTQTLSTDRKIFRSAWLCCDQFTAQLRPIIDQMISIEATHNNPTHSFLPHVTLFSGDDLSNKDCEKIMNIFTLYFPEGVRLNVEAYRANPYINPPAQLVFSPTESGDKVIFDNFKSEVKETLGLDINVNNKWLHATIMYKTVPQPAALQSIELADSAARTLLKSTMCFDSFAFTTGKAWVPSDIEAWGRVTADHFSCLRTNS